MGLRGKLPSKVEKRLKMMVYGPAGCGKTFCALGFPKPYYIDTEKGATNSQYIDMLEKNGGMYFETQDFDDMVNEVRELANIKHDFKTLVIDPITIIYQSLVDSCESKMSKTGFNNQYKEANKYFKRFINLLYKLDMNVILTSHSKTEYYISPNGKQEMTAIGQTYDTFKKSDYMFDLLLEAKFVNGKRVAVVKKSRIEGFGLEDEFEFSYEGFASRYDRNVLERGSKSLGLITRTTLKELEDVLERHGYSEHQIQSLLKKKEIDDLSELKESDALTFIDRMKSKEEKENG